MGQQVTFFFLDTKLHDLEITELKKTSVLISFITKITNSGGQLLPEACLEELTMRSRTTGGPISRRKLKSLLTLLKMQKLAS